MRALTKISVFIAWAAVSATATAQPQYQIFDLGLVQVGDTASQGFGISPSGVAVGRSVRSGGAQAVTWTQGGGLVGLPNLAGRAFAVSNAANDTGVGTVVGTAASSLFGTSRLPVIWQGGVVSQLPLPAGQTLGDANDINSSNVAVGSVDGGSTQQGVIYSGGTATVITQTTANNEHFVTAFGINDSGRIVGQGTNLGFTTTVGIVYDMGSPAAFLVGALPGQNGGIAFAVSNAGHVVGSSTFNGGNGLPFIWTQANGIVAIPLAAGTSQGSARGVNSAGWVVGQDSGAFSIPFLWDGTTTYRLADLIPPGNGWDLSTNTSSSALGISDNNVIVGTGVLNGEIRGYAMVPVAGTPTPSPTISPTPSPTPPSPTPTPTPDTDFHFEVIAPSVVATFQSFNFTVRALGGFNNTDVGYTGTVHFTSTSQGSLPPDSTLTNGFGTFSATLNTLGNQTITATDTVHASITGTSNTILVISDIVTPAPSPTPTATVTPTPSSTPTPTPPVPTPTTTPGLCGYVFLNENFDGVTAPTLPPGWSSSFTPGPANCTPAGTCASGTNWTTSTTNPLSPPNCAFHDAPNCVTDSSLYSPVFFNASGTSLLSFYHSYDLESGLDGAVLEISINGGPFIDFVAAGGGNVGYNGTISAGTQSPIAGRAAWTGNSGGSRPIFSMPPAAGGQSVVLRFRLATDCSGASPGWRIDDIRVDYLVPCNTPTIPPQATPTPSPTPPTQALNLSTRLRVQTGDNAGIGGFIITGSAPKYLLFRGIGPSLTGLGITGALANPTLDLRRPDGTRILANNDWRETQETEIQATGIPPTDNLEAAIVQTLDPGSYTIILRGMGMTTGIGLVEIYDLDHVSISKLANISTRALVDTGENIVIAGFIVGGTSGSDRMILRGIGPSLTGLGISNALADPTLELRDGNGTLLRGNNNWEENPAQAAELTAAGLALSNQLESGIAMTLSPGPYTVLLAGLNSGSGVGLVEVYDLGAP